MAMERTILNRRVGKLRPDDVGQAVSAAVAGPVCSEVGDSSPP